MRDVGDVKEFLDHQECMIFNLKKLIRWLVVWRTGIANTKNEKKFNKVFNLVMTCLEETSGYEGPEGEQYITWGGDKELEARLLLALHKAIEKYSNPEVAKQVIKMMADGTDLR